MNSVLGRYLMVLLLKRSAATLLVLTGLLQIVDLFDTTSDILERGLGVAGIVKYEMLRAPGMIQQILPVSVLIGALTTFTGLARNSEMAALRSTGITIYRIIAMLMPAALLMAVFHFVIADQVAPRTAQALSVWWKATAPVEEQVKPAKQRQVWFRTQGYLAYAEGASADGRRLDQLRIYRRENGRLVERVVAASATMGDDGVWRLHGVQAIAVSPAEVGKPTTGDRIWRTELSPADVVAVFSPEDSISSARAWRAITGERPADKSPAFYTTRVQRAFAEPLAVFVMLLLASPAALAQQRNNQTVLLLFSLGAGLLFLMVDGVLTALGQTNVLPPLLGAWAGPALFAALAGAALVHLEG
jgi:lipopolysaccharide export system permease protein